MSDHALLITDTPSIPSTVAEQTCGVRVLVRRPQDLRREDWDQASRVLVDAPAVSVLASRTDPLPERDGVLLLAGPEDRNRPELYRQALGLGAAHVLTLGPSSGVLRTHLAPHGQRRVLTVGIVDPDPSGVVGTATLASLGIAGAAAGEPLRLLDARPTRMGLHQALQRARHALPAPGGAVCAPCAPLTISRPRSGRYSRRSTHRPPTMRSHWPISIRTAPIRPRSSRISHWSSLPPARRR